MRVVVLAGLAGVLLAVAAVSVSWGGSAQPNADVLPDLMHRPPFSLTVTRDGDRFRLGFASAVSNLGPGPLVVVAERPSTRVAAMRARQLIAKEIAGWRKGSALGQLRFVVSETHRHWHLLPFDTYTLRRAEGSGEVVRASKTGFCLGDRYRENAVPPLVAPASAYYRDFCGQDERGLLALRQGISVGYGDVYQAFLEGQSFDVTGLPAGEYVLSEHVNAERRIRELDYTNNAGSVRLRLSWPRGPASAPAIEELARCSTLACPAP